MMSHGVIRVSINVQSSNMKKLFMGVGLAVTLSGCANYQPATPVDYTGPTATIKDSVKTLSSSKADFYYVEQVDGASIRNSRINTLSANQGRGMQMAAAMVDRQVPARPIRLSVTGRTEYAAPILALTGTVYQVKGVVEFTPEANKSYTVRGVLGDDASVWVEDDESKAVVGAKVEKHGAKLGVFEK
jgi:hypothetical protein